MRFRLQLITISDDGSELIHPVAELARGRELRPETTGLTLAEGKQILKQVQQVIVDEQVQTCMAQCRQCAICGESLSHKGHHQIKLRTVFGKLQIKSPRLRRCPCSEGDGTESFSPLARVLPGVRPDGCTWRRFSRPSSPTAHRPSCWQSYSRWRSN